MGNPGWSQARPIVFVGPSIPIDIAKRTLPHADYRPPIRRGDLDEVSGGSIVGIIDGVFAQTLAISPGEIRDAIQRGVVVYGAASMGALRAAEIPNVVGVGRIYDMYRNGALERDDEVALLFDDDGFRPLTEPLVNVRHAVDRLVRCATLSRDAGNAIVEAASRLHYTERTYDSILGSSSLAANRDANDIIALLRGFDLKRDDAQFLLETLAQVEACPPRPSTHAAPPVNGAARETRAVAHTDGAASVLIWESGDSVSFPALVRFLKLTEAFEAFARNALARFSIAGTPLRVDPSDAVSTGTERIGEDAQSLLDGTRLEWGWESPEEAHVTLADLGLGLLDLSPSLEAEVIARRRLRLFARDSTRAFGKALRSELWLHELSLKREALRLGALQYFARRGAAAGDATNAELTDAKRTIGRLRATLQWSATRSDLLALGVSDREIDELVRDVALARRSARPLVDVMEGAATRPSAARVSKWRGLSLGFESSIKAPGSNRFSLSLANATSIAERIARQMGVVRIGLIGELDTLGIHVAQAFGERSGWSSSFSSGKAETREGARVGSIMEEAEIHAQDAFQPPAHVRTSFASLAAPMPMIDPRKLGLPFDSRYDEHLEIDWLPCVDLVSCSEVLVPSACLIGERVANDIYYSPRLGGKIFSSSGLGSGFSLAEAAVHAAAECIERHAVRLAEIALDNPGGVGARQFWFVDERTLPEAPRRIVDKYRTAGMNVRILDITSDIAVPTFYARVFDDPFDTDASMTSDGFACHPDPEVAVTMALLEAAQTKAGVIAGGREDYSLQARSLGRHERPRTLLARSQVFWFSNDRPSRPLDDVEGFLSRDILDELEWIVDRVASAGYEHLLLRDLTMPRIRPAYAVRVVNPGMETTNPLYTGERARATLIRDLLPSPSPLSGDATRREVQDRPWN